MRILNQIKKTFVNFNSSLLPNELKSQKRKRVLFYFSFYLIVISTFFTVISQFPSFTARGITQIFQIGWVLSIIPLIMLDYRRFLEYLFCSLTIVFPFLFYCIIALLCKINSFSYGATTYVLLSLFLFIIFGIFSKYKNIVAIKAIAVSFITGALMYAGVVFITKLKGYDLNNQIYAFGDKNSAGPLFVSAAVIAFYVFNKRNVKCIFLKWLIFLFFTVIIALSKTRSVLIVLPIVLFILLFHDIKKPLISFSILIIFLLTVIIIFSVPRLRETLIVNILLNGKTDLDSIFSGRLSQIVKYMQNFKPFLGNGGSYIDCMPISLLCSYGIIGFITLVPILILPFYILFKFRKRLCIDRSLKSVILCFAVIFIAAGMLEGYGYLGPGAKVFIFWFFVGIYSNDIIPYIQNKYLKCLIDTLYRATNFQKKYLVYAFGASLLVVSIICLINSALQFDIGEIIVNKLPSTNIVAEYNTFNDYDVYVPLKSMCVGQRTQLKLEVNNPNTDDVYVYWNDGWGDDRAFDVTPNGLVTAKRAGGGIVAYEFYSRTFDNPGGYIRLGTTEPYVYNFDKLYLSNEPFKEPFGYNESEIIIDIGETFEVFYDDFYLPNKEYLTFKSSNESIINIDEKTGIGRAINSGDAYVYAIINNANSNVSVNKIHVLVTNNKITPIDSFSVDLESVYYQNVPFSINPIFNDGNVDKKISVKIEGLTYEIEKNVVTFKEYGQAKLRVNSIYDPSFQEEFDLNIVENIPIGFEAKTNWIRIGEKKTFEDMGIYIVYQNGYKKIVEESDLLLPKRDFSGRAWYENNGYSSGNRTTIQAVVSGTIKIKLISRLNPEAIKNLSIVSSIYTEDEFINVCSSTGMIVCLFPSLASLIFALFLDFRKKIISIFCIFLASALFVVICCLKCSFVTIIIYISIIFLFNAIVCFLYSLHILKLPVPLLEDPIDIKVERRDLVENNYVVEI